MVGTEDVVRDTFGTRLLHVIQCLSIIWPWRECSTTAICEGRIAEQPRNIRLAALDEQFVE
jgi:hypothetical protein